VAMLYALWRANKRLMSIALFVGGIVQWGFGAFLLAGCMLGSTGLLIAPYAFYKGGHLLLQSELLART
jgi:uncharacterized membrane protein